MLNRICIMGRLVRAPELRYTQSQTPVASFTIACERDLKGTDGQQTTDFIDCVAWDKKAEFVSRYFTRGSMAAVSGRLQIRDWTAKDGSKRRTAEIIADGIYFAGANKEQQAAQEAQKAAQEPTAASTALGTLEDADESELPF